TTKSGSNRFHGGAFYQVRNTFFDANYYFNNQQGLPRDIVQLQQRGIHIGGPIKKDRLLFFVNYEQYRLPSNKSYTRQVMMPSAQAGNYTYSPSPNTAAQCASNPALLRSVNVLALAGQPGYPSTVAPILAKTSPDIYATAGKGNLLPR